MVLPDAWKGEDNTMERSQGVDTPLTRLGYARPSHEQDDNICEHEWTRVPGQYANPRGEPVEKYACLFCPATRVEERATGRLTDEADRAGALGR